MRIVYLIIFILSVLDLTACKNEKPLEDLKLPEGLEAGICLETMNSGGYTYAQLQHGDHKIWIAGPESVLKVGDTIYYTGGSKMGKFQSKTLKRTFDSILFVTNIATSIHPKETMTPEAHTSSKTADVGKVNVQPLEGGYTIERLYAEKANLAGKTIRIRGQVVKYNESIMNKNWIHLQDGTGEEGKNDLTVTSQDAVNIGDVIVIEGVIGVDKNIGGGYNFSIILEDGKVIK